MLALVVRRSVALLPPLLVASCVLVVNPEIGGSACHFQGEEGLCGTCIRNECQPAVDGCCADGACGTTMAALDGCASAHDARCDALKGAQGGAGGELAACVRTRCRGACEATSGTSSTRCDAIALSGRTACECSLSDRPNDFICSSALFSETLCCAPKSWPGPGLDCQCRSVSCQPTADGCRCTLALNSPTDVECTGSICCASEDVCVCGERACDSWETRVASCNLGALRCKDGQSAVPSCSLRKN